MSSFEVPAAGGASSSMRASMSPAPRLAHHVAVLRAAREEALVVDGDFGNDGLRGARAIAALRPVAGRRASRCIEQHGIEAEEDVLVVAAVGALPPGRAVGQPGILLLLHELLRDAEGVAPEVIPAVVEDEAGAVDGELVQARRRAAGGARGLHPDHEGVVELPRVEPGAGEAVPGVPGV